MGLFEQFQGRPQKQQEMDPRRIQEQRQRDIAEIKAHPKSYLREQGYDIPDGMTDAKQITQYLLRTGQIGTPRLQQVMSMFGGMPGKR